MDTMDTLGDLDLLDRSREQQPVTISQPPPPLPRMRASNTCDGCALRRVKCDANEQRPGPCSECQKRSLACTSLRVKRKRGPKGPRQTTNNKIRTFQRRLQEGDEQNQLESEKETPKESPESLESTPLPLTPLPASSIAFQTPQTPVQWHGPSAVYRRLPVAAYCRFLEVFRTRVYSVWPIINCDDLARRLTDDAGEDDVEDDNTSHYDYEAWTLAAAACAAVIAQLRLPEHSLPSPGVASSSSFDVSTDTSSHRFAADAEHFRTRHDSREHLSVSSLLSSFFLHVYYANADRLRTAGFCLREALTQAHMLGLDRLDASIRGEERQLRLRVYWVLFVSERTYCIQHGLPPILRPIRERPASTGPGAMASFLDLTHLFTLLDGDLIEPPSVEAPTSNLLDDRQLETRRRVTLFQSDLGQVKEAERTDNYDDVASSSETQRVDLFVTRNWIRILLWEYSVRHFVMSSALPGPGDDHNDHSSVAFSMLLPALVAHSMLGFFSGVAPESIRAHGYGMELKVFRIADSLLDVLACNGGGSVHGHGHELGPRDTLHGLERVLASVGGSDSVFLGRLHNRMAEVLLPVVGSTPSLSLGSPTSSWPLMLPTTDDHASTQDVVQDITDLDLPTPLQLQLSSQFSSPETDPETEVETDTQIQTQPGVAGLTGSFDDALAMNVNINMNNMDLPALETDPFIFGFC